MSAKDTKVHACGNARIVPCARSFSMWLFWIFVLIATDFVKAWAFFYHEQSRGRWSDALPETEASTTPPKKATFIQICGTDKALPTPHSAKAAWILYPSKILYAFLIKCRAFSTRRGIVKECIPCHSSRCKDLSLAIARHSNVTVRMERSLQHFEQGMFLLSTRPFSNARGSSHDSLQL